MRLVCVVFGSMIALAACGDDGGKGDDDDASISESCTTSWECDNGVCACEDGTPCDDEDDCDEACEICQ